MQLLHIDSSVLGDNSVTRQLSADAVSAWRAAHPDTQVEYLDLAANAPQHFGADALGFKLGLAEATLTAARRRENAVTEGYVRQFLAADVVVVGAPMYNFSIPTQLKAWIDRLAQPNRTFRYTAAGPEGLAKGKTVILVSGRGGLYSGDAAAADHQERYLRTVFGFFGIDDVRIVRAEGVAYGPEQRAAALRLGREHIAQALAVGTKAAAEAVAA